MSDTSNKVETQGTKYSRAKVIMITLGGSILEYYNYSLYGLGAALIFSDQFFPNVTPTLAIVLSLATFGSGFLAQPFGSVIFSHIGDKHGRAHSLFITMIILGVAVIGIGLVPSYAVIGIWAPIILLLLRILSGIAAGGEMSGSAIFGLESAPENKRALYGSFTSMGSGIGALLGVIVFFLINRIIGEAAFLEWGWRIPFLSGVVIFIFVAFARKGIVEQEKEEFDKKKEEAKVSKFPLGEVLREQPWTFVKVAGVVTGYMAFAMLGAIYFLTYLNTLGFSSEVTMVAQMLYQIIIIPLVPLMAIISDNWNRKAIMGIGALLNIITMSAFFIIVPGSSSMTVYLLTAAVAITTTIMYGGLLTFLGEQFPTRIRYSGFGVAFAVGGAIGGGFGPALAAIIFGTAEGNPIMLAVFAAVLGLLVFVCTMGLKNHSKLNLSDVDTGYEKQDSAVK